MTTLASTSKKCFVCGTVSQFSALQSTNSFGYPNIILRASKEGARLEMRSWQSLLDHTKVLEPRQTEA